MLETWEKVIDPNYLSAELIGAPGTEKTVTITDIDYGEVYDNKTSSKVSKQCVYFAECKPLVLNKTNAKKLRKIFNTEEPKDTVGRQIILYVEHIKAFGSMVDAIRIKEAPSTQCEGCGAFIKPTATRTIEQMVEYSKQHCDGKVLCIDCMRKAAKKEDKTNE